VLFVFYTEDEEIEEVQTLPAGYSVANRYKIQSVVGVGGMGVVYLAKDQVLGGEGVALKVLHRDYARKHKYMQRFLREVQLMHRVNHPNVVRTFDVGADGDLVYFTMEYVPGRSLQDLLDSGQFSPQQAISILAQICDGLDAIHKEAIVHRDLKPGNVIIVPKSEVKIADFGLARPEVSSLTSHNEVIGSAAYMAPEIWLGKEVTPAIDIYSLGVLAYELVTGVLPYDSDTPATMMRMHLDNEPVPPIELNEHTPLWLSKLILRLLAKNPADRPDNAAEIGDYIARHAGAALVRPAHEGTTTENIAPTIDTTFIEQLEDKSQSSDNEDWSTQSRNQPKIVDAEELGGKLYSYRVKESGTQKLKKHHKSLSYVFAISALLQLGVGWLQADASQTASAMIIGFSACLAILMPIATAALTTDWRTFKSFCFTTLVFFIFAALTIGLTIAAPLANGGEFAIASASSLLRAVSTQLSSALFLAPFYAISESTVVGSGLAVFPQAVTPLYSNWLSLLLCIGFTTVVFWKLVCNNPPTKLVRIVILTTAAVVIQCLQALCLNYFLHDSVLTLEAAKSPIIWWPVGVVSILNWLVIACLVIQSNKSSANLE